MPLPDKVIEQLGREPARTPGWAFGVVTFSGGLFFIVLLIYFGLTYGYKPYLSGQIQKTEDQISQLSQSVSPDDQAKLLNFYSQVSNLKTLLRAHVIPSQLFTWIEKNTEANVSYQTMGFSAGKQLQLTGTAKTEADVNQQIAIYETAPDVQRVNLSSVGAATQGSGYQFNVTLILDPSILARMAAPAPAPTPAASTTTTP